MSQALKCDRCGTFYQEAEGVVSIGDVSLTKVPDTDGNGATVTSTTEIDLCVKCGADVLTALGKAWDCLT